MTAEERRQLIESMRSGQPLVVSGDRVQTQEQARQSPGQGVPAKSHEWGSSKWGTVHAVV